MGRLLATFLAALALVWSPVAFAQVTISFHSFNGSVLFGRYPHTFVVLQGTLEKTGEKVNENYGFSAKRVGPAVLSGPVEHTIYIEKQKYIDSTNRHFTLPISDAQYWRIRAEVDKWRTAPGKYYDLDTRNCIHFVGALAQIVGVKVDYPRDMLRKPKAWLNYISAMNPHLGAKPIG
jgi:hypothetical protein